MERGDDMSKMTVVLATGIPDLDEQIQTRFNDDRVEFVDSVLFKEALEDVIKRTEPDVLLLSEVLEGPTPIREIVIKLRIRYPDTRIIYIMREEDQKERSFLYLYSVFDIFVNRFNIDNFKETLFNPKTFKDATKGLDELITDDDEIITGPIDVNGGKNGNVKAPIKGSDTHYQQLAAFWSVAGQSGRTTSLVNTSLLLSTNASLKILILDFDLINPNVHLQFGFADPNKNLSALIEDHDKGKEINNSTLDDYLYTHKNHKNLKILSGTILKTERPSPEKAYQLFEKILNAAQKSNYSTILVDVNSNVLDETTSKILNRVNKILLHTNETPGSLYGVDRCFDKEYGQFTQNLIDRRKVLPIINRSNEDDITLSFKRNLESLIEQPVRAIIPEHEAFRESSINAIPILQKKPPEEIYDQFIYIANLIHNNLFKKPIRKRTKKPTTTNTKQKGSTNSNLMGGLFSNNKKKKK